MKNYSTEDLYNAIKQALNQAEEARALLILAKIDLQKDMPLVEGAISKIDKALELL